MMAGFRVVAIIAAYNEGDVIGQVVGDLIEQGVYVYLLDHCSTDDTVAHAETHLGRGLLRIERFPPGDSELAGATEAFSWEAILRRKEVLATELEAEWFIHHDADELRESPWAHLNLRDAIRAVDRFGYNAIDFELFDFWPTNEGFRSGDDFRQTFRHYAPGEPFNKVQIKCWKKTPDRVDLASSGGHEARFPDRRVFPVRFVLRHYPIRGQAHGELKVFQDRLPRFVTAERSRGWHVQYDGVQKGQSFLRDPATMIAYDPATVRLRLILHHRGVEALEQCLAQERRNQERLVSEIQGFTAQLAAERCGADELRHSLAAAQHGSDELRHALAAAQHGSDELRHALAAAQHGSDELRHALAAAQHDSDELRHALAAAQRELVTFAQSRSWRVTAPLRVLRHWLQRLRSVSP
jgi:hypothetical protein